MYGFGAALWVLLQLESCRSHNGQNRSFVSLALWRLAADRDARAEVRAAKWWACDAAHRVVATSQHLHGGMGADIEYPIHRFFLMAKQISYSLGNASKQLEQLGRLLAADDELGFRALEV